MNPQDLVAELTRLAKRYGTRSGEVRQYISDLQDKTESLAATIIFLIERLPEEAIETMDQKNCIQMARAEIRERGFMSAAQLAVFFAEKGYRNITEVYKKIPCNDIHVIEYANSTTSDYRRKDLFFFNPDSEPTIPYS